jgi:hypothetical protein
MVIYLYLVIICLIALTFALTPLRLFSLCPSARPLFRSDLGCHMHISYAFYSSLVTIYGHKSVPDFVLARKWANHSQRNNRVKNVSGSCRRLDLVSGLVTLALPSI